MAIEAVDGTAIRHDSASTDVQLAAAARTLPGPGSAVRGVAIGFSLVVLAALLGLLFTAVAFGYSVAELL